MTVLISAQLSERGKEALETTAVRIQGPISAARMWYQVLTDQDRDRLGGDLDLTWRQHGTAGMWQQLHGVSHGRAVADVALELGLMDDSTHRWLLRELGEVHDDPEQAIQQAVASTDLVLVERPREAFWQRNQIDVRWERHSALWDYLWELSRHAKAGQPIDRTTFPSSGDFAIVSKQKSRLQAQRGFPRSLASLIKPEGRYAQKLQLPPHQIRLFELVYGETIREYTV